MSEKLEMLESINFPDIPVQLYEKENKNKTDKIAGRVIWSFLGFCLLFVITGTAITGNNSDLAGYVVVLALLGSAALAAMIGYNYNKSKEEQLNKYIRNYNIFKKKFLDAISPLSTVTYSQISIYNSILIDEKQNKVCFVHGKGLAGYNVYTDELDKMIDFDLKTYIYNFKDILKAEIIKNGQTISSTTKLNPGAGALMGDLIAGVPGAIIGGFAGVSSLLQKEGDSYYLKVIVNDMAHPDHYIYDNVEYWDGLIKVMIHKVDENDNNKQVQRQEATSGADEVEKYAALLERGHITQEEYDVQKRKILNMNI